MKKTLGLLVAAAALLGACDSGAPAVAGDAGRDGGACAPLACMGPPNVPVVMDPGTPPAMVTCSTNAPMPETQMGACCYRQDQASQLDAPEMRIRHITLTAPAGSPLTQTLVGNILNRALEEESFNWLFRVEGAGDEGPVEILTGFGRRDADGTYRFSPSEYPTARIPATLTGQRVQSEVFDGSVTVPVLTEDGSAVQVELTLRNLQIVDSFYTADRNCVGGWPDGRNTVESAVLTGYIAVADSRMGMIEIPPVMTTVCSAIAGGLTNGAYCDQPQSCWQVQPDSLCDATGCRRNTGCMTDVCDPNTTCNAWFLAGSFAAQGIQISN